MRVRARTRWSFTAALCRGGAGGLCVFALTVSAQAQTILGTTTSSEREPLVGVFIQLLDANNREVLARLTDDQGRFLLTPQQPGTYRIHAELIGYDPVETGPFSLEAGEVLVRDLQLRPAAIHLPAIEVVTERRCRSGGEGGLDLRRLWEEARRSLRLSAWTARALMEFDVVLYERELDRHLRVISQQRENRTGFGPRPFQTMDAESLRKRGYTRPDSTSTTYYAPDESVLLSDAFAETHCFHARRGSGETERLLGLSFRPVRFPDNVDIEGTLWLDPVTSELRFLEYGYVGRGMPIRTSEAGGRLDFERLPGGATIIRRWRVRVPLAAPRSRSADRWFGRGARVLTGFSEHGAEVVAVRERRGQTVMAREAGIISGEARGPAGEPLADAIVYLAGSPDAARSDERGRFVLQAPTGRHELRVAHPLLSRLDAYGAGATVQVRPNEVASVDAPIASAPAIVARQCPHAPRSGLLYGRVTALERPVDESISVEIRAAEQPSAPIAVSGGGQNESVSGRTDRDGWYVLCGIPPAESLQIVARAADGALGIARGELSDGPALARVDVQLSQEPVAGLPLPDSVIPLEPIVATVPQRQMFGLEGFRRRKEGGIGRFIDREDIERKDPVRLTDLLRDVPGLRLLCDLGSCKIQFERARPPIHRVDCPVLYFVDGTPYPMTFPDAHLFPDDIEGIEVYTSATVPAEFNRMVGSPDSGSPRCGVILIWTRWR